ncbi:MAG TPA: Rdx family protein [Phycisphaerae bacterium]|nr:SelT/SelW/SelH family protein [Phycisphaerales bacterium]HRX87163.1 Rdx family protein [Phycisphaerae bacterium]
MAEDFRDAFDVEPEMIQGRGGVFDVKVDGRLVYSKHHTGKFPDHEPLIRTIQQMGKE